MVTDLGYHFGEDDEPRLFHAMQQDKGRLSMCLQLGHDNVWLTLYGTPKQMLALVRAIGYGLEQAGFAVRLTTNGEAS